MSWRVWIEGHGWRVAEDTGGLIKGNRIDIYMNSEDEAIRFGRREVRVVVRE
ncbi:MAG: 3D domain-containing protein [Bacillota bacterium]